MKNISSRESRRGRVRDKGVNIRYARSLLKKQKGKCYWLGIELDVVNKCILRKPSLDRIDNSKGYEVGMWFYQLYLPIQAGEMQQ